MRKLPAGSKPIAALRIEDRRMSLRRRPYLLFRTIVCTLGVLTASQAVAIAQEGGAASTVDSGKPRFSGQWPLSQDPLAKTPDRDASAPASRRTSDPWPMNGKITRDRLVSPSGRLEHDICSNC